MLEDNFKFDLQLFAEGEEPTVENTEQPTADSENFDFAINEDGDVVFNDPNFFGTEDDEEVAEDTEAKPEAEVQPEPQPQLFDVTVGGQTVQLTLEELQNGYMRNADYTRKTQALAEERRALQAMNQQQPQTPPPAEPAQPQFTQKEYYEKLAEYAKGQVSNVLGEEFDELNPIHQAAFSDTVATVKAQIYQQQAAERAKQEQQDKYNQLVNRFAQDPNFREIDSYALQRLNELPYAQAVQVKSAFDNYDLNTIEQFMTAMRNEYYGSRNVPKITPVTPKVQPPYVEAGGASEKPPTNTTRNVDWKKVGKLSVDEQAKLMSELGFLKM